MVRFSHNRIYIYIHLVSLAKNLNFPSSLVLSSQLNISLNPTMSESPRHSRLFGHNRSRSLFQSFSNTAKIYGKKAKGRSSVISKYQQDQDLWSKVSLDQPQSHSQFHSPANNTTTSKLANDSAHSSPYHEIDENEAPAGTGVSNPVTTRLSSVSPANTSPLSECFPRSPASASSTHVLAHSRTKSSISIFTPLELPTEEEDEDDSSNKSWEEKTSTELEKWAEQLSDDDTSSQNQSVSPAIKSMDSMVTSISSSSISSSISSTSSRNTVDGVIITNTLHESKRFSCISDASTVQQTKHNETPTLHNQHFAAGNLSTSSFSSSFSVSSEEVRRSILVEGDGISSMISCKGTPPLTDSSIMSDAGSFVSYASSQRGPPPVIAHDLPVSSSDSSSSTQKKLLSYKKDDSIKYKKVSKTKISAPSPLVDFEEHFGDHQSLPPHPTQSATPATGTTSASGKSYKLLSHKPSLSLSQALHRKPSILDIKQSLRSLSPANGFFKKGEQSAGGSPSSLSFRKSFLGRSSTPTPHGNEFDRSMISLPTPVEASREKLHNKLRNSNSTWNLSRTEANETVAIPVEEYQQNFLNRLLSTCSTSTVLNFAAYIDSLVSQNPLVKLAEASFSEVYRQDKADGLIYKVIPFGNEELDQLPIKDIIQELEIAKLLNPLDGFGCVRDAVVVKGEYPSYLIETWDKFAEKKPSQNYRPDYFSGDQYYCIIAMTNGGQDLEHVELRNWQEALTVFWQTVGYLSEAERQFEFEHRDLHWGNILVDVKRSKNSQPQKPQPAHDELMDRTNALLAKFSIEDEEDPEDQQEDQRRLQVTLIDYTLSRATDLNNTILHTRLDHPDFFRGKGDYQFDVYRFMRKCFSTDETPTDVRIAASTSMYSLPSYSSSSLSNILETQEINWAKYCPKTNVLWLHYLLDKLINHKNLTKPFSIGTMTRSGRLSVMGSNASLRDSASIDDDDTRAYRCLEGIYRALDPRKKRFTSKSNTMSHESFSNASDVLSWGARAGLL